MIRLAEGLARAGHEVMVLAPSERLVAQRYCVNGVTVQTVTALNLGHNLNVTAFSDAVVAQVLDEFRPDIIHIQDHMFLTRTTLPLAKRRHLPIVGTNHFLPANWSNNLYIPRSVQNVVHRAMWHDMLQVFNQLDAATTPTETAVAILRKQDIRIPVKAISCGVDPTEFHPQHNIDRSLMRRRYGLDPDRPVLLYVGRVDREKGLDDLVQAVYQGERSDYQVAIAGKGMYRDMLIEKVTDLRMNDQVVFPGFVPSSDLPALLNSIDAFMMPSAAELQSIATLEAMSCGLPILAANARALPELVQHEVNGLLFNAHNPANLAATIDRFLAMHARWRWMGEASLERVQPHQIQNTIQRYVEWYESVCGRTLIMQNSQPLRYSAQIAD